MVRRIIVFLFLFTSIFMIFADSDDDFLKFESSRDDGWIKKIQDQVEELWDSLPKEEIKNDEKIYVCNVSECGLHFTSYQQAFLHAIKIHWLKLETENKKAGEVLGIDEGLIETFPTLDEDFTE